MSRVLHALIPALALSLPGCAGDDPSFPDPLLDPTGELAPGTAVTLPGGLTVGATEGTLDAPVRLHVSEAPAPVLPLPEHVTAHGPWWSVRAVRPVTAAEDGAFVLALPLEAVPQGSLGRVGVAVLEPAADLHFEIRCDGECDEPPPAHVWTLLPAAVDRERRRAVFLLPKLVPDGRTLVAVTGDELTAPPLAVGNERGAGGGLSVAARCLGFQGQCDVGAATAVSRLLGRTLSDLTAQGFPEPYLQRRHVEATRVAPPEAPIAPRYLVDLRPARPAIGALGVCEVAGDIRNVAIYSHGTRSMTLCLGRDGVTPAVEAAARHAAFHAIQYSYRPVREEAREPWILEGTATAVEQSDEDLERADEATPCQVDVPLDRDEPEQARAAQDFWVYIGQRTGRGLGWLTLVLRRGANRDAVDDALAMDLAGTHGLGAAYAQWARNQAYEKTLDLEGALGDQCAANLDTVDVVRHVHHPEAPLPPIIVEADPLQSTMHVVDLLGLPFSSYQAAVTVSAEDNLDVRIYDGVDEHCLEEAESMTRRFVIPPRDVQMVYVLVSNDGLTTPAAAHIAIR